MDQNLILASGSPRRREILTLLKIPFTVEIPTDFVESTGSNEPDPEKLVLHNALGKAKDVATKHSDARVLSADTVVFCEGQILEKPLDLADAARMLRLLQGKKHSVYTCQVLLKPEPLWATNRSTVEFFPMTDEQIEEYIATGEPLDKAGAYAVQGLGAEYIKRIEGDFFGIMGLSVADLSRLLAGTAHEND